MDRCCLFWFLICARLVYKLVNVMYVTQPWAFVVIVSRSYNYSLTVSECWYFSFFPLFSQLNSFREIVLALHWDQHLYDLGRHIGTKYVFYTYWKFSIYFFLYFNLRHIAYKQIWILKFLQTICINADFNPIVRSINIGFRFFFFLGRFLSGQCRLKCI